MVHRGKPNVRLSDCMICNSSTLQESEVLESGTYPVYGANGIVGYLDCYATLNEAIYIIKDGSGVGTFLRGRQVLCGRHIEHLTSQRRLFSPIPLLFADGLQL